MASLMMLMFTGKRLLFTLGSVKYNLMCKCLCLIIFFNCSMHLLEREEAALNCHWLVYKLHSSIASTASFPTRWCAFPIWLPLCHFFVFNSKNDWRNFFCSFGEATTSEYCQSLSQLRLSDWLRSTILQAIFYLSGLLWSSSVSSVGIVNHCQPWFVLICMASSHRHTESALNAD